MPWLTTLHARHVPSVVRRGCLPVRARTRLIPAQLLSTPTAATPLSRVALAAAGDHGLCSAASQQRARERRPSLAQQSLTRARLLTCCASWVVVSCVCRRPPYSLADAHPLHICLSPLRSPVQGSATDLSRRRIPGYAAPGPRLLPMRHVRG